jgi:cytochrome c
MSSLEGRSSGYLTAMVVVAMLVSTAGQARAQDVARGQYLFRKCLLCHVVDPNAKDSLAPPLHNIIGRRAASIGGFEYSDIMRTAGRRGLVWTAEALFYFLDRPEEFMPGTYMAFAGLEEQERRDVIAYLERLTQESSRATARKSAPAPAPPVPPKSQSPYRPPARTP